MLPEARARRTIDEQLIAAGWVVQDRADINLGAALGVAVREFSVRTGASDYLLYVDRKACGVLEAKPEGTTLTGFEDQSAKYLGALPTGIPAWGMSLLLEYESTGGETRFTDHRDPEPRSRRLFAFHRPEFLLDTRQQSPPTSAVLAVRRSERTARLPDRGNQQPRSIVETRRSARSSGRECQQRGDLDHPASVCRVTR